VRGKESGGSDALPGTRRALLELCLGAGGHASATLSSTRGEGTALSIFKAEVIGTALLILLGDGVVAAVLLAKSKAQNAGWIVITFGWGMAVMVGAYSVARFSGAHLNPAVTLGAAFNNGIDWSDAPKYWAGEFVGAFIGAILVYLAYLDHWAETEDPGLKLAVFCTGPAIRNPVSNLITEIIGTFVLVFGIFAITGDQGVAKNGIGVLLVALLVLAIGLSLGGPTGYAINPARDLAPRIAHFVLPIPGKGDSDWEYAWIPVVGPLIGGALGGIFYHWWYPL
jgi:glycerol uptake facilitator protein